MTDTDPTDPISPKEYRRAIRTAGKEVMKETRDLSIAALKSNPANEEPHISDSEREAILQRIAAIGTAHPELGEAQKALQTAHAEAVIARKNIPTLEQPGRRRGASLPVRGEARIGLDDAAKQEAYLNKDATIGEVRLNLTVLKDIRTQLHTALGDGRISDAEIAPVIQQTVDTLNQNGASLDTVLKAVNLIQHVAASSNYEVVHDNLNVANEAALAETRAIMNNATKQNGTPSIQSRKR